MRVQYALVAIVMIATSSLNHVAWSQPASQTSFRVGAAAVDVTPTALPVIRNGGFLESQDSRVIDPLHARCIVFEDVGGRERTNDPTERLAIVVVDSCMIPLDVCDRAKTIAHQETGIEIDRIMISATHTHSAPSVMDYCLGSRADPTYRQFLPAKIAEAISNANDRLEPAQIGFAIADASSHTKCRRYITRTDKLLTDPFGERTVHAMMHPGHQNPNYVGPSGPIDPWLSMLIVQSRQGKPIAAMANFSMHYFAGHPGVSADYYGRFANGIAQRLAPNDDAFVGIMSQGTSGDLWWGDYSVPKDKKPFNNIDQFVSSLIDRAVESAKEITFASDVSIAMAEKRLTFRRRTPDAHRLKWAQRMNKLRGDRLPKDRPEVYALQSVHLHENPTDEVVLQAIRIGDVAICGMPNEVYALTGLKLKQQSPLKKTFNISLANGACGYIPPPEQHALGGYTTWPATTAGLEVQAEPKIVATVLDLLEEVSAQKRRTYQEAETPYSRSITNSAPLAYWRFAEQSGPEFGDSGEFRQSLMAVGNVAYHLPGRTGPFGVRHGTHAVQLAGGKLSAKNLELIESYTVEMSFYLGTPTNFRDTTATLLARGSDRLVITGTGSQTPGRLQIGDHTGSSKIAPHTWYHLVYVRNGDFVQVYLNGTLEISQKVSFVDRLSEEIFLGGDASDSANLEGKIDEVSLFNRALTADQLAGHFRAAGIEVASHLDQGKLDSDPQDPKASLRQIHVADGFRVELVAAEPLVQDPVAIDWGVDGSLWVAEMADYPMGLDGKGKPGGRIRLLRDTNDDGDYDKSTVFLANVSFPNGVMCWNNGVLVTAAPEIFYAEDTDGDDVADRVEPLLTGFTQGNQQLRVNGLRWGLDGWVHCASGGHHAGFGLKTKIHSTKRNQTVPLGSRDFRFLPRTGDFAPTSGPSQYGRVRDDFGNWFGVQNSQPLWHYVLEERYVARNPLVTTVDPRHQVRTPRMPRVYSAKPPQKRFHGFDHAGHYTSACGISIYRDEILFPREQIHAFTCAPFHNLVQHHVLSRRGTSFLGARAEKGPIDFFASSDRWTRPVMSRTGPDGALWVVDMYRYMIEHPEWLPESAQQEMLPGYRAGDAYGRIYRIVPTTWSEPSRPNQVFAGKRDSDDLPWERLLDGMDSENGIVRDLAHRYLLSRNTDTQARSEIIERGQSLARSHPLAEVRNQALSLLEGFDGCDTPLLLHAIRDRRPEVRLHAIRVAERVVADLPAETPSKDVVVIRTAVQERAEDSEPSVRLQVALTLGEWPDAESGRALAELAARSDNDTFTQAAIVSSASNHYATLCDLAEDSEVGDTLFDSLIPMSSLQPSAFARLIAAHTKLSQAARLAKWLDFLNDQQLSITEIARSSENPLSVAAENVVALIARIRQQHGQQQSPDLSIAACWLLGREPSYHESDTTVLASLLAPQNSIEVQQRAIQALARIENDSAADAMLAAWPQMLPTARSAVVETLLSRTRWHRRLIRALTENSVSSSDLSLAQQQRLMQSTDRSLAKRAQEIFSRNEATDASRAELIASYAAAVSTGDSVRGGRLFKVNCQTCHTLNPNLRPVGPDLRSLSNRSTDSLLQAVLLPSQSIEPRYTNYQVATVSGQTFVGIIAKDDASSIELQTADGKSQIVARSAIERIQRSPVSLMPEGFESKLSPSDLSDIFAFLRRGLTATSSPTEREAP